jgi:hypothetical protein
MIRNQFENVVFLVDPKHRGRISILSYLIAGYDEAGQSRRVVASEILWRDRTYCYDNSLPRKLYRKRR